MSTDGNKHNSQKKKCSDIEITVRIKECPESKKSVISKVPNNLQMLRLHNDSFTFDYIKWGNESQERVYKTAAYPFVEKALCGHNATIVAYGPAGTGKSYTMGFLQGSTMSKWQNSGLIQRSLKHIFEENGIQVSASFVEIYDGEVHDLLKKGAMVHTGLAFDSKTEDIESLEEGLQLVNKALQIRQEQQASSSSLQNNISSSQSHALLTLHLKIKDGDKFLESKLNLVDLSGSKIHGDAESGCYVFGGRSYLDESLSALEQVITGTMRNSDEMLFPKDSKLTSILEDFLDTTFLVSLVACISSDPASDYRATVRTLQVATSIKSVQIQRHMECTSALSTNQLKSKTKGLPADEKLSESRGTKNIEIIDKQDASPIISRVIGGKIKDCMVVLRKSEIDFNGNKKGPDYTEYTAPLDFSGAEIPNQKIPLINYEAGCSAETESTLSISRLQTQNTDQDTLIKTELTTADYSIFAKYYDDSLSASSLEDMVTVNPAKLHTNNDDESDKCQCFFRGFESANDLVPNSQPCHHSTFEEKQSILVDNVSQLSISVGETVDPIEYQKEMQGSSSSAKVTNNEQLLDKRVEVFPPVTRISKMKRMNAILTTDFTQPGSSQIDYQTPKKVMKLDKKIPKLMLNRVSDPQPEPEEIQPNDNHCDNIENQEQELNDKQRTHNDNILRILNTSTAEQLIDLPRIGFKTAVSIYQYRLIHGEFKSLKHLEHMPIWTEKICHHFFAANNISFEQ